MNTSQTFPLCGKLTFLIAFIYVKQQARAAKAVYIIHANSPQDESFVRFLLSMHASIAIKFDTNYLYDQFEYISISIHISGGLIHNNHFTLIHSFSLRQELIRKVVRNYHDEFPLALATIQCSFENPNIIWMHEK